MVEEAIDASIPVVIQSQTLICVSHAVILLKLLFNNQHGYSHGFSSF